MKYELDKNSGLIKVLRLLLDLSFGTCCLFLWLYVSLHICREVFLLICIKSLKSFFFLIRLIVSCTHQLCTHTTTASFLEPFVKTVIL